MNRVSGVVLSILFFCLPVLSGCDPNTASVVHSGADAWLVTCVQGAVATAIQVDAQRVVIACRRPDGRDGVR